MVREELLREADGTLNDAWPSDVARPEWAGGKKEDAAQAEEDWLTQVDKVAEHLYRHTPVGIAVGGIAAAASSSAGPYSKPKPRELHSWPGWPRSPWSSHVQVVYDEQITPMQWAILDAFKKARDQKGPPFNAGAGKESQSKPNGGERILVKAKCGTQNVIVNLTAVQLATSLRLIEKTTDAKLPKSPVPKTTPQKSPILMPVIGIDDGKDAPVVKELTLMCSGDDLDALKAALQSKAPDFRLNHVEIGAPGLIDVVLSEIST
eukprot:6756119-Prymnesium_polylepis.2